MNLLPLVSSPVAALAAASRKGGDGPGGIPFPLIVLGLMFFLMYFLMIRPQRKRQRERLEMLGNLSKNDRVMTVGGIIGTITKLRDREVVIKVKETGVELTVSRSHISRPLGPQGDGAAP